MSFSPRSGAKSSRLTSMVTIGGGIYRSRKIEVPSYLEVPTKSIVRLGIANALSSYITHARVMDLFAGSGAMGIELLSRGASFCLFSDINKEGVSVINRNLKSLGIESASVKNADYKDTLRSCLSNEEKYDVIFIDPPYKDKEAYGFCFDFIKNNDILTEEGILVFEYEGKLEFDDVSYFDKVRTYKYGRTNVAIYWRKHI